MAHIMLCLQFYLDDLEDELNITALRMLVKDLLILFQACNEGVINVLGVCSRLSPKVLKAHVVQSTTSKCPKWMLRRHSRSIDIFVRRQSEWLSIWVLQRNCRIC